MVDRTSKEFHEAADGVEGWEFAGAESEREKVLHKLAGGRRRWTHPGNGESILAETSRGTGGDARSAIVSSSSTRVATGAANGATSQRWF